MRQYTRAVPIIYYHSVAPAKNPGWRRSFLTLKLAFFEDQMRYLKRNGFKFISLGEQILHSSGEQPVKGNAVCLTFDDGYVDNFIYVYPLLKKYGAKATIFISPEYIDDKPMMRRTLEDYWNNRASLEDIDRWGYLSWDEMAEMEKSGCVDIQSHTMSHTKYFISGELLGFHHPGADSLYPISNLYPECKPGNITDPEFHSLIPNGYPFFEEASAVVARKAEIDPDFIRECCRLLKTYDFAAYRYETARKIVDPLFRAFRGKGGPVIRVETEEEYGQRLRYEIVESKKTIEAKLNKTVDYLCWPHGDNSAQAHALALEAGYKATAWGNLEPRTRDPRRIDVRIGTGAKRDNRLLTLWRAAFKIKCAQGRFPHSQLYAAYLKLRY